jgi:ABC-2 type transport system ATP-binding protein
MRVTLTAALSGSGVTIGATARRTGSGQLAACRKETIESRPPPQNRTPRDLPGGTSFPWLEPFRLMHPVETSQLRKSYGPREVLHGIALRVARGRLTGFLGPNGAGKSTTIRILMGLLRASSGEALLFGQPARSLGHQLRAETGYLAGEVRFYPGLSGRRTLEFLASARRRDCRREMLRLAEALDLDLARAVRKYSTGMKQKLGLIQALMHKPALLLLDEPTNGLDPLVRQVLFAELRQVVAEGRTVLFSSHTLPEVEELCDDVIILRDGLVIEQERIEVLRARALRRVGIRFSSGVQPLDRWPEGFIELARQSNEVTGTWRGPVTGLLAWLGGLSVDDIIIDRPGLEDLFLTYYSSPLACPPHDHGRPAESGRARQ